MINKESFIVEKSMTLVLTNDNEIVSSICMQVEFSMMIKQLG